jgi:hypothetical protein
MSSPLENLEQLLPELPAAIERRSVGHMLAKTIEALNDSNRQAERLRAVIDIARETGFETDSSQAAALEDVLTIARETADELLKADTADQLRMAQECYSELKKSVNRIEVQQIRPHWRRVVQRDFEPFITIGSLLEQIDHTADLGRRLSACGSAAERTTEPMVAESLRDAIRKLRADRASLESERLSVTEDPEVDSFLNALASGEATLKMVTERVHRWLVKNDALDRFAITPRPGD